MLVLYGAHDEIVAAEPMCAWLETLRASDEWQVALYPSGWHLLTRDLDAARALADRRRDSSIPARACRPESTPGGRSNVSAASPRTTGTPLSSMAVPA